MSEEHEEVGDKIDRLNTVINRLMIDNIQTRNHSRFSLMSSLMTSMISFSENIEEYPENIDDPNTSIEVPQVYLDKFQECLTEIDRLNMKIEDMIGEKLSKENPLKIFLDRDQLQTLHKSISSELENSKEPSVFILNKNSLVFGTLELLSLNVYNKVKVLENETFVSESQKKLNSLNKSSELTSDSNLLSKYQAEIELQQQKYLKLQQELLRVKEELDYKTAEAETNLNEYKTTIEELRNQTFPNHVFHHQKTPSQDITRAKTPISTLNSTTRLNEILTNHQKMKLKIQLIEKMIKKKYDKKRKNTLKDTDKKTIFCKEN